MQRTKYLDSMKKLERIVREDHEESSAYLKYLLYYKDMDKDLLKFLNF